MKNLKQASLALSLILMTPIAFAVPTVADLVALKQQVAAEEKNTASLQAQEITMKQKARELADRRRFYQIFRTEEEKQLAATRKLTDTQIHASQGKAFHLKKQFRQDVSDHIAQNDADYSDVRKLVNDLQPVALQGETAVKELIAASQRLGSAQVPAALNATGSVLGALSGSKPGTLDHLSAGLTQMEVNNALKAGQGALNSAAQYVSQLQGLAGKSQPGIFSGNWDGAVGRGLIFALITGRNPLSSQTFLFSNSMFQLSNLSTVKGHVRQALATITPVSEQMTNELKGLQARMEQVEVKFIQDLK